MLISNEMITAGVRKAIELGILPRKSVPEDFATNVELMQEILDAALNSETDPSYDLHTIRRARLNCNAGS